jgi:hypothetical protein
MPRRFLLSPSTVLCFTLILVVVELASGTSVQFVSMMAVAVFSACLTYNMLGGARTIAGLGFSGFALSTLIISQVGKALLFEKADQNLDVPHLTISVYAVYYASLMLGTFAFSRLRLPLQKPLEAETPRQMTMMYFVALGGGVFGFVSELAMGMRGGTELTSLGHGFARALSYLLPFSLVLAVDRRIRDSMGRGCFGWTALWPTLVMLLSCFLFSSRTAFVEPFLIVFLTSFLRHFKFGKRHLFAAVGVLVLFVGFVSPFCLYARAYRSTSFREQASTMLTVLEGAPAQWATIKMNVGQGELATPGLVSYFATPGAVTVNRFALIGQDSTLINACSAGFHYGFMSLKLDLLNQIPRFLYPNKPTIGSNGYLGHLDGQESDAFETTNSTITPIADSFGAFGWTGVVLFPFFVLPAIFVTYESMFDVKRAWGTVAVVLLMFGIVAGSMGDNIWETLIKTPIYLTILSWVTAWVIRMVPTRVDRVMGHEGSIGWTVVSGDGGR